MGTLRGWMSSRFGWEEIQRWRSKVTTVEVGLELYWCVRVERDETRASDEWRRDDLVCFRAERIDRLTRWASRSVTTGFR